MRHIISKMWELKTKEPDVAINRPRGCMAVFASGSGHLSGIVGGLENGDGIWLPSGLHVPLALKGDRKCRSQVTRCVYYVYDMMHIETTQVDSPIREICLVW